MSSSTSSATQSGQPSQFNWGSYALPPAAAAVAIPFAFKDLMDKSAEQRGELPKTTFSAGFKSGMKASPTVGMLISFQDMLQGGVEKKLLGEDAQPTLPTKLASSALVGIVSSPVVAVFNGQTLKGGGVVDSLRKFSLRQGLAISFQEAAFVAGLSAAGLVAAPMKERFGDTKAVEYAAAFTSGAFGSLAGHPANTALTRWQSGQSVESARQLMWGSMRKARAIGLFSVLYKMGKETGTRFLESD